MLPRDTGITVEKPDKYLRKLGLELAGKATFPPVEKLVELKTLFEIPFRKDRAVGSAKCASSSLRP